MARSVRSRLGIGRRYTAAYGRDVIVDGAGARNRREAREASFADRLRRDLPDALERMMDRTTDALRTTPSRDELLDLMRLKQVPELTSVDDVHALHETLQPEAPVYRVSPALLGAVGVAGVLQKAPTIEKVGVNEAIGAHFDEYRSIGADWTVWRSVLGGGILHACFIDDDSFESYQEAVAENDGNALDESMRGLRRSIGAKCLNLVRPKFMAKYTEGDTFMLWHGSLEDGAKNPGVHSFDRTDEGIYTIHAAPKYLGDDIPAGFTRLN